MTNRTIDIHVPVLVRVEGEGALDLKITDQHIDELHLRIYEPPRYFEKFLEGRNYYDIPDTVARICGICPVAYQMSAIYAIESVFDVETKTTIWTHAMRRAMYCGEWLQSHSLHIHMLAGPDYLGFSSVIEMATDYADEVRRGLKIQTLGNDLIALWGGRSVHPVGVRAGGFHKAPTAKQVEHMLERLHDTVKDAEELVMWTASLDLPDDEQDFVSVAMRHPDEYPLNQGRIVSDNGLDISIEEYENYFVEHQVPHSTALHSLLMGKPYLLGPLARINLNKDKLPKAVTSIMEQTGISFPSRNMFHSIVARAIEIHYVILEAIRILENYEKPEIAYADITPKAGTGYGCSEAPRGLLWHRYEFDDNGIVKKSKIVPPTSQNQARIEQDLHRSLEHLGLDKDEDVLRLHAEKVIRNYDPCISCATHFLELNVERGTDTEVDNIADDTVHQNKIEADGKIKIIGVGSPFGADQVGWEVVKHLKCELKKQPEMLDDIILMSFDRPGVALLEQMEGVKKVILIDALSGTQKPGQVLRLTADDINQTTSAISSHSIGLRETLMLGKALDNLPEIILFGVDFGDETDDMVDNDIITRVVSRVMEELESRVQNT